MVVLELQVREIQEDRVPQGLRFSPVVEVVELGLLEVTHP
jgi:hypothetical protein